MGLSQEQINFFTKARMSSKAPEGLTWHHHQDTGRMQLVDRAEHEAFVPHTGGMSIWGGGYPRSKKSKTNDDTSD
jgi:A nuclease of the HNH/ENDO VII superfamily with conserved WHH